MKPLASWPRFVPTLVSRPNESVAYLTGGYELKLKATAASRALHAPAQKSVARYDIDDDHWWEVPTERQWREVMGFDWRDARQVAAVSAAGSVVATEVATAAAMEKAMVAAATARTRMLRANPP